MSEAWNLRIQLGSWSGRVKVPKKCPHTKEPVTAEEAVNFAIFAVVDALHANGRTDEHPDEVVA